MKLKPSNIKPEHRNLLKKLKPAFLAIQLYLLRVMGLVFKGAYAKYGQRDPDFSELNNRAFFIITLARSGSTALYELFNSHKDIYAYNEVLSTGTFYNFFDFLERCAAVGLKTSRPEDRVRLFKWYVYKQAKRRNEKVVVYDIKLELMHLINSAWQPTEWRSALFQVIKEANIGVVYLYRENLLERYISSERARHSGTYHQYSTSKKVKSDEFLVETGGMLEKFHTIEKNRDFIKSELQEYSRFLEIKYEDLFVIDSNGESRFNPKIIEMLRLHFEVDSDFDTRPRTQKVNQQDLFHQVANRGEIILLLKDTPFRRFLPSHSTNCGTPECKDSEGNE